MVNTPIMWKRISDERVDLDNLVLNIVDDQLAEEGVGQTIAVGVLSMVLGWSGIVNAAQFDKNMTKLVQDKQVQGGRVTVTKSEVADVIEKSKLPDEKVGQWTKKAALNILARTLYMEARGEGKDGLNMVMTVIWNRAGGDKTKLADVCLARKQFSCWNDLITGKTPSTYSVSFPKGVLSGKGGADAEAWNRCVQLANSAINGTFKPVNSKWNSYYNPKTASPSWGSQLVGAQMVGNHKVGELTWMTKKLNKGGNAVASHQPSIYTVKDGDNLWSIARANNTTVKQLMSKNGLKSDVIRPGQTLTLPT